MSHSTETAIAEWAEERARELTPCAREQGGLQPCLCVQGARPLIADALAEERAAFEAQVNANIELARNFATAGEKLLARTKVLEEELSLMVSYLGHEDQDADHGWMVKHMRAALLSSGGVSGSADHINQGDNSAQKINR